MIYKGFTLIELLIVFSLIGVLTSLGLASYSTYNSSQILQSSSSTVATLLTQAHSQAISQVVPSSCGTNVLTGYEVDFTVGAQQYTLSAVCGASKPLISTYNLPTALTFASGTTASIVFNVSSGIVSSASQVIVSGYSKSHTINVSTAGNVSF
jgi:prepilin-type N-terminal cleavage/methylation domain-containing protein